MNQTDRATLIAQARAELAEHINVPIYRTEVDLDLMIVTFHLYGGQQLLWFPRIPPDSQPEPEPLPDGLTVAAGIGRKTAQALNRLEIINLRQLAAHYLDDEIVELMTPANYRKLGTWLDQHGFFA